MDPSPEPEAILRELSKLWTSLAKEGETGVLRACAMTLIVLSEESDDAVSLGETIAALMPEHPSRAILVRLHTEAARPLAARVYAQCWMPFGQRRQICCEQIEITAPDSGIAELAALILPLTAADLPTIIWCRHPRMLDLPGFADLAAVASKQILDSSAFPDTATAFRRIAELCTGGRLAADLAWTRITPWRELISRIFENRELLARLPAVNGIRVAHGLPYAPSWSWYLAAWVASAVRSAGGDPKIEVVREAAAPNAAGSLEFTGGLHLRVARDGDAAVVQVDSLATRTLLPRPTEYLLLREELSIVRSDPVFEKTLPAAAGLAVSSTPI